MRRGRAADEALRQCIYSGTALRCISPSPLYPRTRCPGLTENGSALRTTAPLSRSSASPKRIGMDIRHTPTHSPLTLRVSGVTENSAFPTRLRRAPPLTPSHRHPSPRRIGDALFFRNPIRTERSGGRMGLLSPHTLSALRRCATTPEAEHDRASGLAFS